MYPGYRVRGKRSRCDTALIPGVEAGPSSEQLLSRDKKPRAGQAEGVSRQGDSKHGETVSDTYMGLPSSLTTCAGHPPNLTNTRATRQGAGCKTQTPAPLCLPDVQDCLSFPVVLTSRPAPSPQPLCTSRARTGYSAGLRVLQA